MYYFHSTLHARPPQALPGPSIEIGGRRFATLALAPEALAASALACSFEEAAAELVKLERMYCEPDGSFVWVSRQGKPTWQVDGNLFDRDGRLRFVDLKGCCPAEELDRLLAAFGWPATPMMFQLARQAVLLDEAEFRRFAQERPVGP